MRWPFKILAAGIFGLGLFALLSTALKTPGKTQASTVETRATSISEPTEARPSAEPPLADVVLHPSELIKDPFSNRGKRIRLDVSEYPLLFEDNLLEYREYMGPPGLGAQLASHGLKFKRMVSPALQLYDVVAVNQGGSMAHGTDYEAVISLGELLVRVVPGQGELDIKRPWVVEPLGVVEARNGFGAPISVAAVRFSAYFDSDTQDWPTDEDKPNKDPMTGLVYYPTVYSAADLLDLPAKFKGRVIQMDMFCISIIANGSSTGSYCGDRSQMPPLTLTAPVSDAAAIYTVNAIRSPKADEPMFPAGRILISVTSGSVSALNLARHWFVEVLDPARVRTETGETQIIPAYRFVSYH